MATNGDNSSGISVNGGVNVAAGKIPKKTVDLNSVEPDRALELPAETAAEAAADSVAAGDVKKDGEVSKGNVPMTTRDDEPVNDVQKKILRAERFGLSVNLSEEEKRNSRAERFGTATPKNESKASKNSEESKASKNSEESNASKTSEESKRKSRAERFGLPVSSAPADEEVKKKARLARFESDKKIDSVEEEKRKARALRFSKPSTKEPAHESPQKNIENEAAVAGNAV